MKALIDGEEVEVTLVEETESGELKVNHDGKLLTITKDQLIEEPETEAVEKKEEAKPEKSKENIDIAVLGAFAILVFIAALNK